MNARTPPDAKTPQNETCETCHFNQFGSADNGKGKGCKEGSRLVFLSADQCKSVEAVAGASLAQARLSVLNSKTFRNYIENVFGDDATWTSISMLTCRPDPKSQYAVNWEPVVLDVDDTIMNAIADRVDEAEKLLIQPYQDIEEAPPAKSATPARRRKF